MSWLSRRKKRVVIIFSICCMFFFLHSCTKASQFTPVGGNEQRPFTDLSEWSFESEGPVRLFNNVWELYWKKLYLPEDFSKPSGLITPVLVKGGNAWNGAIVDGEALPANGYATYRTILKVPESGVVYSFYMTNQDSSYKLWIGGKFCGGNGKVAVSAGDYKPQRLPKVYYHYAETRELELVLQIANYDHKWGGLTNNIFLGTTSEISGYITRLNISAAFIGGAILIMAIYHLFVFFNRKIYPAPLYLSMFCFAVLFWYLFQQDYFFFRFFPDFPLFIGTRLNYISMFISVPLFLRFIDSVYPGNADKRILFAALAVSFIIAATPVFMPVRIFSLFILNIYYVTVVINCIIILTILIRAVIGSAAGGAVSLAGFVIFFGASIYDILANAKLIIGSVYGPFMPYSLFIFILLQSFLLARRFSGAYNRLDDLLLNLERLLSERTRQLAEAQREVADHEKLAAIGIMVGGISHEIMNPLSGISGPLSVLKKEIAASELSGSRTVKKHLEYIEDNTNEITTAVRNLNVLIKDNKILKKKIDLAGAVNRLIEKTKNQYPDLDIQYIDESERKIEADDEILLRMLSNLVTNSIDSAGAKGVIRIIHTEDSIIVKDNGIGMSADMAARAFDAFYTTKSEHGGTGLGLYLVKRFAASLGWTVKIESEPGQGASVSLMIS